MGRRKNLQKRFATGQAAAKAGVHIPSERGTTMKPGRAVGPRGAAVTQPAKSWPEICFSKNEGRAYKIGTSKWSEASLVRADGAGHSIIKITGFGGTYRVVNCHPGMISG